MDRLYIRWVNYMVEVNFNDWRGKDATNIKSVLGKQLTFYGEQDFHKQAVSKKDPSKTYTATYHIIYAVDKTTGEKIKIFGSDNLHKILDAVKDKYPFDDSIVFVEGKGKFGHGYYKLKNTRTPFQKKEGQATTSATKQ